MFPIRGQTLLVRITPPPPTSRITIWDSTPVTYIVPRRIAPFSAEPSDATFFIGGTNDNDNWDPKPTPQISQGILERVRKVIVGWAGEDAQIEVLREQVGLRPGRKDGPRVELEVVDVGGANGKVRVVHQYGHAGAGFQNSIGSARKAVGLVEEALG
jgi:D-amino-acid oxidase